MQINNVYSSYFIRQKIEQRITKKIVFPNKITKRFLKSVEAAELKSLEPEVRTFNFLLFVFKVIKHNFQGVLRVHVFEAKDLERKDVTGKSDPYVILNVGAQECRTHVIKRELNPKWDYWCEVCIILQLLLYARRKISSNQQRLFRYSVTNTSAILIKFSVYYIGSHRSAPPVYGVRPR